MTPSNPLVAGPIDPTTPFSGTGLLEDGYELVSAIERGDWVAGGLASFSALANTVATAMDPLGSLIAAGLGWLFDHLEPLKGWLNDLTGDAGEVAGFAATWGNIAQHLQKAGETLDARLADVSSMSGEAIDAYLRLQSDVAAHISAAGAWAGGMKTGMEIASMLVQVVHELVRDTLSQLVGSLISYATTLVLSLGTATPYVIAQATSRVSAMTARISGTVLKLVDAVTALGKHLDKLKALFQQLGTLLARGPSGSNGPRGPRAPRGPDGTQPDAPAPRRPSVRERSTLTDEQLQKYLEFYARTTLRRSHTTAHFRPTFRSRKARRCSAPTGASTGARCVGMGTCSMLTTNRSGIHTHRSQGRCSTATAPRAAATLLRCRRTARTHTISARCPTSRTPRNTTAIR